MRDLDLTPLADILTRLRDPESGCPWDKMQTFFTIAPYTIEEAYEVRDAIERGDMLDLCDELGDLLLQVVYHARMAEEASAFALADVVAGICDKMIRRHPHVFGDDSGAALPADHWDAIKAAERVAKSGTAQMKTNTGPSAVDGVATALPALVRAQKIQKRAARVGFDWPDAAPVVVKLAEELAELDAADTHEARTEEIGDILFTAVNLARHHHVDAEQALRQATAKFERRFKAMEGYQPALDGMDAEGLELLWQRAKRVDNQLP